MGKHRNYQQIWDDILDLARDSMPGIEGERRAAVVGELLRKRVPEYAAEFGVTEELVLKSWEAARTCNVVNYYQESRFMEPGKVHIFDTRQALYDSNPGAKFVCPACGEHSNSPLECDSGKVTQGAACNWKSYGFLGCMGKGVFVMCRDLFPQYPYPLEMFRPAKWPDTEN